MCFQNHCSLSIHNLVHLKVPGTVRNVKYEVFPCALDKEDLLFRLNGYSVYDHYVHIVLELAITFHFVILFEELGIISSDHFGLILDSPAENRRHQACVLLGFLAGSIEAIGVSSQYYQATLVLELNSTLFVGAIHHVGVSRLFIHETEFSSRLILRIYFCSQFSMVDVQLLVLVPD
jgi:hypothetical protein